MAKGPDSNKVKVPSEIAPNRCVGSGAPTPNHRQNLLFINRLRRMELAVKLLLLA